MKLSKPCYMIKNVSLDLILPPCRICTLKFRAYYETKRGANVAVQMIKEFIEKGWVKPAELEVVEVTEVVVNENIF